MKAITNERRKMSSNGCDSNIHHIGSSVAEREGIIPSEFDKSLFKKEFADSLAETSKAM